MRPLDGSDVAVLLLGLGLLIGTARLLGELARRFRQPAVLGELLAGVLLGPTVLGALLPEAQALIFPASGPAAVALDAIGTLAIVLFLLVAGMEVDLSLVWRQGAAALKVATVGTVLPFGVALVPALLVPSLLGRQEDAGPIVFALFLATAMAISALPVIARTLMDLDLYRTDIGVIVVSAAVLNDLVGWTVFAVILSLLGAGHGAGVGTTVALTLLYAVVVLTVVRWCVHKLLPYLKAYTHWPGGILGFAATLALLGAAFTEAIGAHAIFGAFLIGVALGDSSHLEERTRRMLDEIVSFIFAPVFFASIGLRVDFVSHFDPLVVGLVLLLACATKVAGGVLGARWAGLPRRERWAVGFALNARGAMEIILGVLALQAGVIRQRLFVALVVTAMVTSAMSGPLIRRVLAHRAVLDVLPLLSGALFVRDLRGGSRRGAIRHLVEVVARAHPQLAADTIEAAIWRREELVPTGLGNGVALPHARLPGLTAPVVAVGLSDIGVDFDAPDGQGAHVVFLVLTPAPDPGAQLELSASIARRFRNGVDPTALLAARTFTEFIAQLKTLEPRHG